ncbi:unnamed protein product [Peniophora sp. CBMAI 1063]|nr:unnamed protein product [Peniophora sp. CBMAI 1063]
MGAWLNLLRRKLRWGNLRRALTRLRIGRDPAVLGPILLQRYLDSGFEDDTLLEDATQALRRAAISSEFKDVRFIALLSACLRLRYERSKVTEDLEEGIALLRRLLEMVALDPRHDQSSLLSNLGYALENRFRLTDNVEDLDEAIAVKRRAIELTSDENHLKPSRLINLGALLQSRHERNGEPGNSEAVIAMGLRAVELMPDVDRDKPVHLDNLGDALETRYERTRNREDLDAAVAMKRRAVELTPDGHDDQPAHLCDLSLVLQRRFQHAGELDDLHEAVKAARLCVDCTPDGDPAQPLRLCDLSNVLQSRFQHAGELNDLHEAVATARLSVELTYDGHSTRTIALSVLGEALERRYERLGELEDFEEAISVKRRIVELLPDEDDEKPVYLNNLSSTILTRFRKTGDPRDLDVAMELAHRAIELTNDGDSDKPDRLCNLGDTLQARSAYTGRREDLESAISIYRRAIELASRKDALEHVLLTRLGNALHQLFRSAGELVHIEQAISTMRLADELIPEGHFHKSSVSNNLSTALLTRFECDGELRYLEESISRQRRVVRLISTDKDPHLPTQLSTLGNALMRRFQFLGELEDLNEAISTYRRAIEFSVAEEHSVDRPAMLSNLGMVLELRFERIGTLYDLEEAISTTRHAAELIPEEHPHKPHVLITLGDALQRRFEQEPTFPNFVETHSCFVNAANLSASWPSYRLQSSRRSVDLCTQYPDFGSAESLLEAHSHVLDVLPEIVWLGHSLDRRYEEAAAHAEYVYEAVSAAIRYGMLSRAIVWLESGRYMVWTQLLALRTPLDELKIHHPDMFKGFRDVQQRLKESAHMPRKEGAHIAGGESNATNSLSAVGPGELHRSLAAKYDGLLSEIRNCEGFEDFLRPQTFSALLKSLEHFNGYFVYINVHKSRCDALVLGPRGLGDVTLVPLSELSLERAQQLQLLWIEQLRIRGRSRDSDPTDSSTPWLQPAGSDIDDIRHSARVDDHLALDNLLGHLWTWVADPVLRALDLTGTVRKDVQPHVTWCPTGALTRVPLHAAGLYSEPSGPRVFNYVVSSYAPSIASLARASAGLQKQQSTPTLLVVTQPNTPGQSPLPGTVAEGRQLQRMFGEARLQCNALNHKQATREAVRAVMARDTWAHFSCHGSQHPRDATKSAFHLYDGPLTLSDLMQTVADDAELAFLSACQTATGDANNPEEAVHLAAGMLAVGFKGVVATMWSIGDADAPVVVEAYYKKLLEMRSAGTLGKGETGAAYALHEAVKVLRDRVGERDFSRWAPFVHFGV